MGYVHSETCNSFYRYNPHFENILIVFMSQLYKYHSFLQMENKRYAITIWPFSSHEMVNIFDLYEDNDNVRHYNVPSLGYCIVDIHFKMN